MKFIAKDKGFITRVRSSFKRQRFQQLINAELYKIDPGYCEVHIPFDMSLTQQHSFFHGGVIGAVADTAAGYAAFSLIDKHSSLLTVEFKLNLMAPADGQLLIGKANVLKYGRTLTICRADIYIVKNGVEKLCAASQSTFIELKNHSDTSAPPGE